MCVLFTEDKGSMFSTKLFYTRAEVKQGRTESRQWRSPQPVLVTVYLMDLLHLAELGLCSLHLLQSSVQTKLQSTLIGRCLLLGFIQILYFLQEMITESGLGSISQDTYIENKKMLVFQLFHLLELFFKSSP